MSRLVRPARGKSSSCCNNLPMSLAEFSDGMRRLLGGDFGESWVSVAAAGSGITHGQHATTDLIKADIELTLRELVGGVWNPAVLVQVKTDVGLRDAGDAWAYDLDVATYEVLRLTNHRTRRVLAVIGLSAEGETLRIMDEGTLLVGQAAWVSLEGEPASANTTTQVVKLPKTNTLDRRGLRRMLETFGVPRSTPVPSFDVWNPSAWDDGITAGDDV